MPMEKAELVAVEAVPEAETVESEDENDIDSDNLDFITNDILQSIEKLDLNDESGTYIAKGPMRGLGPRPSSHPYSRPARETTEIHFQTGQFVTNVELEELQRLQSEEETGIPGLPPDQGSPSHTPDGLHSSVLTSIDDILAEKEGKTRRSRLILRNETSLGTSSLIVDVQVIICEQSFGLGIEIPRTVIPKVCIPADAPMTERMDVFVQLCTKRAPVIKFNVGIEEAVDEMGQECWFIKKQALKLDPFVCTNSQDGGVAAILRNTTPEDLAKAHAFANSKTDEELLKRFGPHEDSFLMAILLKLSDEYVFAVAKRILTSPNPTVRANFWAKNRSGFDVFRWSCYLNKPGPARFFAEVFYCFGEDLMFIPGKERNTILHLMAKSDTATETLDALLRIRLSSDNTRLFPPTLKNERDETPFHVATKSQSYRRNALSLLHREWPECVAVEAANGQLPLHYACVYSTDPALVAAILHYSKEVVNKKRADGSTPLHILASRAERNDRALLLFKLDEETQYRMIKLLLEHGADKTIPAESVMTLPVDLVHHNRPRIKALLEVKGNNSRGSSKSSSPRSGSPRREAQAKSFDHQEMSPGSVTSSGFGSEMSPGPRYIEAHSPGLLSNQASAPMLSPYGNGSVSTDRDSDSDLSGDHNDLDAVVGHICNEFPAMQDILDNL